jgi:hypothetical protein
MQQGQTTQVAGCMEAAWDADLANFEAPRARSQGSKQFRVRLPRGPGESSSFTLAIGVADYVNGHNFWVCHQVASV